MNKQFKKIFFGSLAVIATCVAITGCGPKEKENKIPENIELVHTAEDGTKVNKSDKINNETKKLGDLEFKNISITETGERTKIEFDVYNSSDEMLNEKELQVILLNTQNEEIKRIKPVYIGTIPPKGIGKGKTETTLDYTEVYDIKFIEQENI
ncbi:MAG: hypothetical protein J6B87_03470 [Clostridia bacterium]|nr:hypothetical protein [Clostridia bacterium]